MYLCRVRLGYLRGGKFQGQTLSHNGQETAATITGTIDGQAPSPDTTKPPATTALLRRNTWQIPFISIRTPYVVPILAHTLPRPW